VTESERAAAAACIGAADVDLGVVQVMLDTDEAPPLEAARLLLGSVETELGRLASAAETDTETARRLLSVRDDLSGYLLAAGALETAGAPTDGVVRMLRRAVGNARAGLDVAGPTPVGAIRR
jgi:hypothetical protein